MVFSSLIFLFAYLPAVLIIYFAVPVKYRNLVLFIVSLAFYGWGEPVFILVMMFSVCTAYFCGFKIARFRDSAAKKAKGWLVTGLLLCLAVLLFFKYTTFVLTNLAVIIPAITVPELPPLPIGISFYTFQIMSYLIDVYRGDTAVQKRFVSFGAYVTLFPQLIAGPIVRYRDVDNMLNSRSETVSKAASGVVRFCCGLAKKVLLADSCAAMVRSFAASGDAQPTALAAWMGVICFTFEIYFDFSGYSDMAIGLGRIFGFEFLENFNYPYISNSVTDFWRRWHISLSTWFREYVYIPLGGNRRGKLIQYRNIAVVWLLTGIWHGASWNFVLWGVYFGVLLMLEKAFLLNLLKKIPKFVCHIYTMLVVVLGWLLFSAADLSAVGNGLSAMFGGAVVSSATVSYDALRVIPLLAVCAVGCTPLPKRMLDRVKAKFPAFDYAIPALCAAAVIISTAYMVDSTYSPFLYFNF